MLGRKAIGFRSSVASTALCRGVGFRVPGRSDTSMQQTCGLGSAQVSGFRHLSLRRERARDAVYASHARPSVGIFQTSTFKNFGRLLVRMLSKCPQERANGAKNEQGIPPRKASHGLVAAGETVLTEKISCCKVCGFRVLGARCRV
jgi:hypothetical protein